MKVLRLYGVHDLRLQDEPGAAASQGESLVRITSVGICGSDLHWYEDGTTGIGGITTPFVLGHEFAGIVEGGPLNGTRVAVDPQVPCEVCEFCLEGSPNLCQDHYFAGQAPQDGALQEYLSWPEKNIIPLPDSLSDEDGAMLEPLGIAIHTVDLGKVKPGMTVGIYGCGPIGLLVMQVARLAGAANVIATERLPHRLEYARRLGADHGLISDGGGENEEILKLTEGRGVDVAFETAGENEAVETAIETCKPGGRVVLCGIPADNRTSFKASTARKKGLTLMLVRRMKHTYPRAIRLVEGGFVDVRSVVTDRFPLTEFESAFHTAEKRDGLKVMVEVF